MIRCAVIGAAGYTGGELLRLLVQHPRVAAITCISASQAGKPVDAVHRDLFWCPLSFEASFDADTVDVIFLCGGHGEAQQLMLKHELVDTSALIIDLSQDFRLADSSHRFVYGLPELFPHQALGVRRIANPGCFATAIQLALAPLAAAQRLPDTVHITAITGSTGAGQKLQDSSHFSWRAGNVSVYKAFEHQHLAEIQQSCRRLQPGFNGHLHFVPIRGPFTRGILCSLYLDIEGDADHFYELYSRYYARAPFVHCTRGEIDLKQVLNTNHALLSLAKHGEQLHVVCCLDNLLKGAAGQAVQNMNLVFDLPETEGLSSKPQAF